MATTNFPPQPGGVSQEARLREVCNSYYKQINEE